MKTKTKKMKKDPTQDERYIALKKLVLKHNKKLWIPPIDPKFKCVNKDDTFFQILKYNNEEKSKNITLAPIKVKKTKKVKKDEENKEEDTKINYKSIQVKLDLTKTQKLIIDNWLNAYIKMYNETLKFIKNVLSQEKQLQVIIPIAPKLKKKLRVINDKMYKVTKNETSLKTKAVTNIKKALKYSLKNSTKKALKKLIISIERDKREFVSKEEIQQNITSSSFIRTYCLVGAKEDIIKKSGISHLDYNTKVPSHVLDYAIKLACANYKSAITNYKKGNIKHFRIRYWKYKKDKKILDVEKCYINESTIFPRILGNMKFKYDGKEYNQLKDIKYHNKAGKLIKLMKVDSGSKLQYNALTNKYYLFIPIKIEKEEIVNKNNVIAIDPGVRNFINGISENGLVKIGEDVKNKIQEKLKRIDHINNKNSKVKHKKKKIRNKRRQLENLVKELHWKTIHYLTENYNHILIGDLSAKRISSRENTKIPKMTKRIALAMSYYKFRQRLEYKCKIKGLDYRKVDEAYTSKTCSVCGSYNEKLGGKKVYVCVNSECKKVIGRDDTGARNICMLETI